MAERPLAGARVLDLSSPLGAWAGRLLADLGADTVLVEPPEGDPYRRIGPFRRGTGGDPESLAFAYFHANKRGVTLDLEDRQDRGVLAGLGSWADVILVSPSPERPVPGLDCDNARLDWAGPATIVGSITPYGITGPYRDLPATHLTSYARAGQMSRVGAPGTPPRPIPGHLHWHLSSAHLALSVLAALAARPRVGAQFIDLAALEVEVYHDLQFEAYDARGRRPGGRTLAVGIPPTGTWDCLDGTVTIGAHNDRHWTAFLEMLGHPEELNDPGLADMAVRRQIHDGVDALIAPIIAARNCRDLVERGQRARLPICSRNTAEGFIEDPQLRERGFWTDVAAGAGQPVPAPGPPVRTSPTLFEITRPAPRKGEHDAEIRTETPTSPEPEPVAGPPSGSATGALEGMRVLSLGVFMAGNTASQLLASLGADVVKVEPKSRPESLRYAAYNEAPTLAYEPSGIPNTPMLASLARGTRGLALEMGTPEGRALFRDLVGSCDVLLENFGAALMRSWEATFDDLVKVNPRLVMVSLSGFGRTGSRADHLAYASNISDFTGLTDAWWPAGTLTDYATATHAIIGALGGCRHVAATGEGVHVDAAQSETFAAMGAELYLGPLSGAEVPAPEPPALVSHVCRCAGEDRWAALEILTVDQWNAVCSLIGRSELTVEAPEAARKRHDELVYALDEWAVPLTPMTVAHVLARAGVPASAVATDEEVYFDPHLNHRRFPATYDSPDLGRMSTPGSPHRLSVTPGRFPRLGPRVGEHTVEVLETWVGLDGAAIDRLIKAGVVFDGRDQAE